MAKKFNFRLEPVRKLKEQQAAEAKNFLAHAMNKRLEKEQEIREVSRARSDMSSGKPESSKAVNLQAKLNRMKFLDDELKRLETERKKLLDIEAARRKKLNDAMKEEKTINKLKEKKEFEHKESLKKEETEFIDELVIIKENKKING